MAIDSLRKEKLKSMVTRIDIMSEMAVIRKQMDDLKESNEELRGLLLAALTKDKRSDHLFHRVMELLINMSYANKQKYLEEFIKVGHK